MNFRVPHSPLLHESLGCKHFSDTKSTRQKYARDVVGTNTPTKILHAECVKLEGLLLSHKMFWRSLPNTKWWIRVNAFSLPRLPLPRGGEGTYTVSAALCGQGPNFFRASFLACLHGNGALPTGIAFHSQRPVCACRQIRPTEV